MGDLLSPAAIGFRMSKSGGRHGASVTMGGGVCVRTPSVVLWAGGKFNAFFSNAASFLAGRSEYRNRQERSQGLKSGYFICAGYGFPKRREFQMAGMLGILRA